MNEYGAPEWSKAPVRAITTPEQQAYLPFSPTSNPREAIFMRTLSSILDADRRFNIEDDLKPAFLELSQFTGDGTLAKETWDAFASAYITETGDSTRGSGESNPYINPFHVKIPQNIKTSEPRDWGSLYRLLMTDGLTDGFNQAIHEDLKQRYAGLEPSNAMEALVVSAVDELIAKTDTEDQDDGTEASETTAPSGIPPYVADVSAAFQEDLKAWVEMLEDEPTAIWLKALKDLICFHYMMYLLQLCKNLHFEYEKAKAGALEDFSPHNRPIHFGMWDESASSDREFSKEWNGRLDRMVYDSWGRLVVMRVLTEQAYDDATAVDPQPMTLSKVICETPAAFQSHCQDALLDVFPDADRPDEAEVDDVVDAAVTLSEAIRRFHASKPSKEDQSAYTLGYKVIRQLGTGKNRKYFRVQANRAGTNFRFNQSSLRLFARLFETNHETRHINQFQQYLEERGIALEEHAKETMIEQLDDMSLLQKMSDSKDAIYVESI